MKKGSLPAAVEEEEEQHLALKSSLTDWGKRRRRRRKGYLSLSPPKRQTFAKFVSKLYRQAFHKQYSLLMELKFFPS